MGTYERKCVSLSKGRSVSKEKTGKCRREGTIQHNALTFDGLVVEKLGSQGYTSSRIFPSYLGH